MNDFRFIEIEEEFEDEEEEDTEEDYDEREFDEDFNPEGIVLPWDPNLIFDAGDEFDTEDEEEEDDDDEEEDDFEDDEEEEELIPMGRMIPRGLIEDDDYEDESEEEEDYEEEEMEELVAVEMPLARVSNSIVHGGSLQQAVVIDNGLLNDSDLCEGNSGNREMNTSEIDGLLCPICFEAWTSGGNHQICCLPCGHLYGLSCIRKWLLQRPSSGKCPQCNNVCTVKDVRVLYTTRLCVADEELHKRVRSLEAKCAYMEQKAAPLTPEELIDQICNDPILVQRLATKFAELQ